MCAETKMLRRSHGKSREERLGHRQQQVQRSGITGTHRPETDETNGRMTMRTTIIKASVYQACTGSCFKPFT